MKLGKIEAEIPAGAFLVNPELITIEAGAVIEPGCYIKGPCFIGAHSTVRHGAYIRGDVIVGQNSVVGHDSEVKNSILLDHCHAAHFAYVGDSILGNHVNLGAGTKCANLRLDNKPVILFDGQARIDTGLRKFGAVVGDGSQIGCNAVTNPGTLLGKHVFCYPCTNLGGIVPANSTVRSDTSLIISPNKARQR
jgi:NDP-sugar pyrophosphorylase family protein